MLDVIYEDNHIIIVNKKPGDIVQGDFLGITHRLDRPTSGIVIFARTSKALTRINKLFAENEIKKTYLAIVDNTPPKQKDTITHYLVRNRKQNKSYANDKIVVNSKKAMLTYEIKAKSDRYYLLEIQLHTGRHHQIRAQLAKIACKIKGDLKYGFPRSNSNGGISLHAYKIEFIHPVKKEKITLTANPQNDKLWDFFISKI